MPKRLFLRLLRHIDIVVLLISGIFVAGMAWSSTTEKLDQHEARLNAHDARFFKDEADFQQFREGFAAMKQEIDDIHERVVPNDRH